MFYDLQMYYIILNFFFCVYALHEFLSEDALQLLCRETQLELAADGYADAARFLTNHDGYAVALVGNAQRCTMAQTQVLGDVKIVTDG